ncbi:hypothetical protein V5F32_06525 [Xanthobacter oligotrophicus]|uniref:DUF2927 domain-containing protein n=1 Tax=Xanthobacter oligotrophicus TaxID=2607286 RepID=A0ABW6ZUS2_9HYPH
MFLVPMMLPLVFLAGLLAPARALETGAPQPGTRQPEMPSPSDARQAMPSPAIVWPDTPATRRAAQDFIETLNRELLAQPSATLTLERWCGARGIGDPALVRAERERAGEDPAPEEVRALLGADAQTPVRHRRVRLTCGAIVLSEADNYYRPDRLTTEMNAILDATDTPFGKVVRPLDFRRRTLETRLLWQPADEARPSGASAGPSAGPLGPLVMPRFVLAHRAVLTLPDGTPFSALIERYTSGVLAFPAPK